MAKSEELKVLEKILGELEFISRTLMVHFPTPPPGHGLPVPAHQEVPAGVSQLHPSTRRRQPAGSSAQVMTTGGGSTFIGTITTTVVFGDEPPEPPAGVREPRDQPLGGGGGGIQLAAGQAFGAALEMGFSEALRTG